MTADDSRLLDEYLDCITRLREAVADVPADRLRDRPVPGAWSILEVIAHLADSEQAWCHRMKRTVAEERPVLIGYDESAFTARLDYHARDLAHEIDLFEAQRRQMAALLATLPTADWDRVGMHSESGPLTLRQMVRIETDHVSGHLRHVDAKRGRLGLPPLA